MKLTEAMFRPERASAPALIDGRSGREYTYAQTRMLVEKVARELSTLKVRRLVAVVARNSTARIIASLAADLVDIPALQLDPDMPRSSAAALHRDMLVDATIGDNLEPSRELTSPPGASPETAAGAAQLFLTSGSTGQPRAVWRTSEEMLEDGRRVGDAISLASGAMVVSNTVLFHNYGFNYSISMSLLAGASLLILPPGYTPNAIARAINKTASILITTPAHCELAASSDAASFGSVDRLVYAGAGISRRAARVLSGRHKSLYSCYGSTEAGAVCLSEVDQGFEDGWIGRPLPNVHVAISDGGELMCSSSSLARGYFTERGVERFKLVDGYLATGDLVETNRAGDLKILGRSDWLINVGGRKVNPIEIENVLNRHPRVSEAVVTCTRRGRFDVPVAYVVAQGEIGSEELSHWVSGHLPEYKTPRRFVFTDALPRVGSGKIDRERIKQLALGGYNA